MKNIKIDIWSDIVCPFCFIGKKKLEQAIAKLNLQNQVEIEWHSFQLDPEFPKGEAIPSAEYLAQRKNYPIEQINAIQHQLTANAKPYGIDFQFEKALSFNTLDVHRLWQWSKLFGKSSELKEALMKAYFTDGIDLSKEENVLQVVENCDLNKLEAQEILQSDKFSNEVDEDIYHASQIGVRGVPFFVLNNQFAISGAQEDSVFENALFNLSNQ
jgi:predicted DsbA family dithiol-disulfide isomerase